MGAKKYFKNQFSIKMLTFEHDVASLFYLCSFAKNRSSVPMLCVRGIMFLGCIGIMVASIVLTSLGTSGKHWPIYLTHWGLVLITLSSGFGFAVSARAYFKGPIDSTFGLPWYVKAYWLTYTTTIPIAFFITIFYWTLLTGEDIEAEYAMNFTLDIFIHAVNSILMFILLITARHPVNILHFCYPILLGIIYVVFTVIYHFAGGLDQFGNSWIYPVLDWENPGIAAITTVFSAVLILVIHLLVVGIALGRDAIFGKFINNTRKLSFI